VNVKKVLLTGMSGVGKSRLVEELAARGYRAVDLDQPGWSEHAPDGDWVWCEERVRDLLEAEKGAWLFVSGCAENQVTFHPRFDTIVLLSAPRGVVLERLATRTNNPYGKRPEEVAEVLGYMDTVEPRLRRVAHHEVVTSVPLEEVVAKVLRLVGAEA
jgi:shikimate kinase